MWIFKNAGLTTPSLWLSLQNVSEGGGSCFTVIKFLKIMAIKKILGKKF